MHVAGRIALVGAAIGGLALLAGCGRSERDSRDEADSTLKLVSEGIEESTKGELSRSEVNTIARAAHMIPDEEYYEAGVRMGSAYVELEPAVGQAAAVEGAQFVGAFPDVSTQTYAAAFENLHTVVGDQLDQSDVGHALMRYQIYSEDPMTPADGTAIGEYLAPALEQGEPLEVLATQEMAAAIDAG